MSVDLGGVLSAVTAYGDARAAEQTASDADTLAQAVATEQAKTAAVQAAFDAYKATHTVADPVTPPPTPTPTPDPTPEPDPPAPQPQTRVVLGYYPATAGFAVAPECANVYLQPTQRATSSAVTDVCKAGVSPTITKTTKGTQTLAGITSGDKTAIAWMKEYAGDVVAVAKAYPKLLIVAALEHEFRVKTRIRPSSPALIDGASADPAIGGKAMGLFALELRAQAKAAGVTNVQSAYWVAGSDRDFEGAVGAAFAAVAKFDRAITDPYSNGQKATLTAIADADVKWFKAQPWYAGQPIDLGEFGMAQKWGDDEMAKFYTDCRKSLAAAGISRAAFFNSNSGDFPHIITAGYPKAKAAFEASLRATS